MSKKPETRFVKKLRRALILEFGGFWYKNHGNMFSLPGLPDLTGVVLGVYIGIEAKVGTNKTSSEQKEVLRQIRRAGGIAFSTRCEKRACFLVRQALIKRGLLKALEGARKSHQVFLKKKTYYVGYGDGSRENPYDISESSLAAHMGKRRSSIDRMSRLSRRSVGKRNK
jgi:hypothetical protein